MSSRSGWNKLRRRGLLMLALAGLVLAGTHPLPPAAAQDASSSPDSPHREMELQRYRDAVRRHFVLKEYEELLELTEKYGHLYPEDKGTEFYRTQAELRIQDAEKEIPFERLQDREFQIPGADSGQPSLLDELRNGSTQTESGPSGSASLTVEPGGDSQIAMGTQPGDEAVTSPFEAAPAASPEEAPAGDETRPQAPPAAEPAPSGEDGEAEDAGLPPSPEQAAAGQTEAGDSGGGSPLPLILGGTVLVLGAVAAFLLIGMARRGKKRGEAAEEEAPAAAAAVQEPPAPPLFNFEDSEGAEGSEGASEFSDTFEAPEPFAETGTVEAAGADASAGESEPASVFEESPPGESAPPEPLGETRGTEEVNQEISDLLFAPEAESGEDSVFGTGSESASEPPPPLGETKTEETAFGEPGDDTSDLVQIPDDDSLNLDSSADVDALFSDASPSQEKPAEPAPAEPTPAEPTPAEPAPAEPAPPGASAKEPPEPSAETSVNELSSIDLFGEESSAEPEREPQPGAAAEGGSGEGESTSSVDMNEVDAMITESGGGSSSSEVDLTEPAGEGSGEPGGIEIPFAMEDPFQNLSGKTEESEPQPQDDETAFNTSTAETLAAQGADTGVEERELLEVIEEGGEGETRAGEPAPPADSGEEDVWSGLGTGTGQDADPESASQDEVQSFREDETASFEIDDADETQHPAATPEEPQPRVSNPDAETVIPPKAEGSSPGDLPDDPFDRERQRGHQAVEAGDWTKAVYHLSIAASLNPDADDVREELRHARKMKKEQQSSQSD